MIRWKIYKQPLKKYYPLRVTEEDNIIINKINEQLLISASPPTSLRKRSVLQTVTIRRYLRDTCFQQRKIKTNTE